MDTSMEDDDDEEEEEEEEWTSMAMGRSSTSPSSPASTKSTVCSMLYDLILESNLLDDSSISPALFNQVPNNSLCVRSLSGLGCFWSYGGDVRQTQSKNLLAERGDFLRS